MDDRTATADSDELAEFGYRQELDRTLGNFHTFAAGISYISILTGTFQLFYFGFALGGPAYWWSWPMVFAGQLMVALCFCELAARYPVAGSIYNWSKRLSSPHVAWLAGWMMLTASIVTDRLGRARLPDHAAADLATSSSSTATARASTTTPSTR